MRLLTRIGVAFAIATGATLTGTGSATAQSGSSPIIAEPIGFPADPLSISGVCSENPGYFEARLEGTGGSSTVGVAGGSPDPSGLRSWNGTLEVPWSMADGPATVTATCSTPTQVPATVTIQRPYPPAVTGVVAQAGNGYLFVMAGQYDPTAWFLTATARQGGTVVATVSWPAWHGGASVPVANGVPTEVVVTATNRYGTGAPSAPVTATAASTLPAPTAPPAPVIDTAASTNAGGLTTTWLPPLHDNGAQIFGWSVAVVPQGSSQIVRNLFLRSDHRSTSVDGLAPGIYDLYVAGVSALGYGSPAHRTVRVNAATSGPRTSLEVADSSVQHRADRLIVSWLPPSQDRDSPVAAYSVAVIQGNDVVAWRNVGPTERQASFPELAGPQPPTWIYIQPVTGAGFGPRTILYTGG